VTADFSQFLHLVTPAATPTLAQKLQLTFDPLQLEILNPAIEYGIVNCCRQYGKTFVLAFKALTTALEQPGALILFVAPTRRQTAEPFRRITQWLGQLNLPVRSDGLYAPSLVLPNNSRILGLPARPGTIRGYSPNLVIVDEAAYCSDELEAALRPMMMNNTTRRAFWLVSTPNGRQGMFYDIFTQTTDPRWHKFSRTAYECPRIKQDYLAAERDRLGPELFAQEYLCEFHENHRALFPSALIQQAFDPQATPLAEDRRWYFQGETPLHTYIGLDLGRDHDHAALAVLEYLVKPKKLHVRLRHLHEFDTGTSYVDVINAVLRLLAHGIFAYGSTLVIDATGLGAPVTDFLRHALRQQSTVKVQLAPVVITGAHHTRPGPHGTYYVPKLELAASLRYLLDQQALQIASRAPHAERLRQQLENMRRTNRPSGIDEITGKSQHANDDLVSALSLAAWRLLAQHRQTINTFLRPPA